jgi:hypothetical protein
MKTQGFEARFSQNLAPVSLVKPQNPYLAYISHLFSKPYIEKVPNRNSPPAVLRPDSYREGDQVKKRTLANLSKLPDDIIDNLKLALKGALQSR